MPTASNVLCGCGRFMRVKHNSVTVEELFEDGSPYKLWDADLWECLECGVEIITGFAQRPFAEHYQPDYHTQRARAARPIYPGRCRANQASQSAIRAALQLIGGVILILYDTLPGLIAALLTRAPKGRTLQERYPPGPGAFVTHYSSVNLTDEWFVSEPRHYS